MCFAVVTWKAIGSRTLPVEEVEVLNTKNLVIDGKAEEGAKCSMQYNQEMWHGEIHSLHGKLAVFKCDDCRGFVSKFGPRSRLSHKSISSTV